MSKFRLVYSLALMIPRDLAARFLCAINANKQDLWLVSERGTDARDNGYCFFKYLQESHPEINSVYVIDKNSVDAKKVSACGKMIQYGSFKHYVVLHQAKYLISSHIMGYTPMPEGYLILEKYLHRKMFRGKRIFLQHGIIKDSIEGLKYPNTQVDLFICGAKPEYDYISETYHYPKGVVQYTGLARYDHLVCKERSKKILFMPTWRKWLNSVSDEEFQRSEYYKAYDSLMKNKELNISLEQNGYSIVFYVHYEFQRFSSLFTGSQNVRIATFQSDDVQQLLIECDALLTDYSSVYFDVAYMGKPVVYYQFDKSQFFSEHYHRGYFDESSFGPVCKTEDEAVSHLVSIMRDDNEESDYLRNKKNFFVYRDQQNCRRIFEKIKELDRGTNCE